MNIAVAFAALVVRPFVRLAALFLIAVVIVAKPELTRYWSRLPSEDFTFNPALYWLEFAVVTVPLAEVLGLIEPEPLELEANTLLSKVQYLGRKPSD